MRSFARFVLLGALLTAVCLPLALTRGGVRIFPEAAEAQTIPPEQETPPKKLALIIAVADYPYELTGVTKLSSDNDVPLVRGGLMAQGFDSTQIRVLPDAQATREGIVTAIREHLIDQASPGDVVFIHYSGHGHQITDDNGDEIDGYDEVLVPYDAPGDPQEGYDGHLHVRDDELGELLSELQEAVGSEGNVVFSIDACFSGSATRGARQASVRGIREPIGPPARVATRGGGDRGGGFAEGGPARTRGGAGSSETPFIVISAARHDEPSWEALSPEGIPVGSLSLALSQALVEATPGTTYRGLFDEIKETMAELVPLQTPQMEGVADTELFSGHVVQQAPYIEVDFAPADTVALLRGGALLGILPETEFSFFPPGTRDPSEAEPIATGKASRVNALRTEVFLSSPLMRDSLESAWAFVTRRSLGDFKALLRAEALTRAETNSLASVVESLGTVALGEVDPDLVLRPGPSQDSLVLISAWDDTVILGPLEREADSWVRLVTERGRAFAMNRLLARVEMDSPGMEVALEVIPARHEFDLDGACMGSEILDPETAITSGGQMEFSPGDQYLLNLTNLGEIGAYVTVLDLLPDGTVGQLFPLPQLSGEDNYLEAGTSHQVSLCYEVTEPFGVEVLKLFATRERVDFFPIVTSGSVTRGAGPLSPLEEVFAEALSGTRSGVSPRAASAGVTQTTVFQVVQTEKKERRD